MAERASVFQVVQIGIEDGPGDGQSVANMKKLQGISVAPSVKAEVKTFRSPGMKFPAMSALGKDWVEAKISGQATYSELLYLFSSVLCKPAGPAESQDPAFKWVFTPSVSASDPVATFVVEQGSDERAHKFNYGIVSGMGLKWSRDSVEVSGTMIGQQLQDNASLSASSALEAVPVLGSQVSVSLGTGWASFSSPLTRCISGEWSISERWGPVWALGAPNSSFASHVEKEPKMSLKLLLEADAVGMGLLADLREGTTKFVRVLAEGDTITGSYKYMAQIDMAGKVTRASEFKDQDGIFAIEFEFTGASAYDSTALIQKAVEVTLINRQDGL